MLKLNQLTGLYEDDGLPEPQGVDAIIPPANDNAVDTLPVPGLEPLRADGGAAPAPVAPKPAAAAAAAPVAPVTPLFPAKPEHETKVTRHVESEATKLADAKLANAQAKQDAAVDADTAIKVQEAEAKAEDAKLARLEQEKKAAAQAYWEDQKRRKVEENLAADKLAREESVKEREHAESAGNLTGAAKTFATVLTTLGALGQTFAALGHRGAQAWEDGNPIEKLYEAERQKRLADARKKFDNSETARKLAKEGRDAELQVLRDRLEIGVNNEFQRDQDVRQSILNERVARLGPKQQQAAGDLLKTAKAAQDARIEQENRQKYDSSLEVVNRSPTASASSAAAANKALTPETAELVEAANSYERLAARQKELTKNGIPQYGADATEFEKNEQAMRSMLQKKFGKSDNDAKLAADQQGSPGFWAATWSKVPGTNTLDNYHRSLDANLAQLKATADERVRLEGPEGAAARRSGSAPEPKPTLKEQVQQRLNKKGGDEKFGPVETRSLKDGTKVKVRKNLDTGKYEEA